MSIIFKQERIGYLDKSFMIYKFTTMDDDGNSNRWQKLLRVTGLDELPQIWNILKGDLVLIGPRPLTPQDHKRYRGFVLTVKPGLTGWWQIHGRIQKELWHYDLEYMRIKSWYLNLYIIWKTIPLVLLGKHG